MGSPIKGQVKTRHLLFLAALPKCCLFIGTDTKGWQDGGGMRNTDSDPTITNCAFSNNYASRNGGAMQNSGDSDPTITNCIFSGNTADRYGGGMSSHNSASPTITNSTFTGNHGKYAGAMSNFNDAVATIKNCIIWNNEDDDSTTTTEASIGNWFSAVANISYSLVANLDPSGTGNIDDSPTDAANDPDFTTDLDPSTAPSTGEIFTWKQVHRLSMPAQLRVHLPMISRGLPGMPARIWEHMSLGMFRRPR